MHEEELQQIGLSEKEAKVYLATLTLGKATAQEVAKKTDLKRPTTYFTIDALMKKGLMSSVYEGKKQFFMAENPERLVDVFEAQQDEVRRQGEKLKKLIPDLKQLRPKTDGGPVVKYYEGKEGIMTVLKDALTQNDKDVYMIYSYDMAKKVLSPEQLQQVRLKYANENIRIKSIYTSQQGSREASPNSTRILVNSTEYPIEADVSIFDDRVRIITLDTNEEPAGIIIHDSNIARTLRSLFLLAWKEHEGNIENNQ